MAKGFNLRHAEFVPAASFVMTSFERDREELATRFSEFTSSYIKEFQDQHDLVDGLEQGLSMTQQQKEATQLLYAKADELDQELNFVSFYFNRAGLDTKIVSAVKKILNIGDMEGALLKTKALHQYLMANLEALTAKGMSATFPAELEATRAEFAAKNNEQNQVMNQRKQLYSDNSQEYQKLYTYLQTVTQAGKIMYKGKPKSDEYNMSKVLGRMRRPNDGNNDHGMGNG